MPYENSTVVIALEGKWINSFCYRAVEDPLGELVIVC
jgi:hypothetical protein